jgi:hypothetical protein
VILKAGLIALLAGEPQHSMIRTPNSYSRGLKNLPNLTKLNQTGTAALVDCFAVLRSLPDWILPVKRKARELHSKEKILYMKH